MKPALCFVARSSWRLGHQRRCMATALRVYHPKVVASLSPNAMMRLTHRYFQTEREYYKVADETLEIIQDTVERALEDVGVEGEVSLSSGVLTIVLPPPHGTYVINKQTPNRQIWWSSPISGPRRYEYNPETKLWVFTRDGEIGLGETLNEEFQQLLNVELELEV
jgi:frataxin